MSVSTEWAWNDEAIVVTADGRVDGTNARDFQSALEAVIEASDQAVILDMERLTYISSAGLRVILLAAKSLQRKDATLTICSLSDPIREIFSVSGFDQIIPFTPPRPKRSPPARAEPGVRGGRRRGRSARGRTGYTPTATRPVLLPVSRKPETK